MITIMISPLPPFKNELSTNHVTRIVIKLHNYIFLNEGFVENKLNESVARLAG